MIPKRFVLVNREWSVNKLHKDVSDEGDKHGDACRSQARIRVAFDGAEEATFYHELAHALLWVTTKPKLSNNEDFVESLGSAIHQFMLTRQGRLK